ncbi:MAG: hypothetical protein ABS81_18750 [Pseudonocardia sp. SCN 72-86]|nr:MAG: hypothetical protein ABS81_18750 [Pseudonocardia sp. SCN 72-86]
MDAPAPETVDTAAATTAGRALMLVHTGTGRRAELTRRLGLTRTGGAKVLAELEQAGLVEVDDRPAPSGSRGRPSHLVGPARQAPLALAASISARRVAVALVGLGGSVVATATSPTPATPDAAARLVATLAHTLVVDERRPLRTVGIAVASAVDGDGRALAGHHLGWDTPVPVRQLVADALDAVGIRVPVVAHNDADCAALAEHRRGAGRNARHLLYLTSGDRGIGGALVTNGLPYRGHAGTGSELTHLTVDPRGRPCHCGNRGCLDVEADATALVHPATPALGELDRAARRVIVSDAPADRDAVARVTAHLATALVGLVNILNPDLVILAGLPGELLRAGAGSLAEQVRARTLLRTAPLTTATLDDAILLGAAEYAFDPLLRDPLGS